MAELVKRNTRQILVSKGTNKDRVTKNIGNKKSLIPRKKDLTAEEQKKYATFGFNQPGYSGKRELKKGGKNE